MERWQDVRAVGMANVLTGRQATERVFANRFGDLRIVASVVQMIVQVPTGFVVTGQMALQRALATSVTHHQTA